MMYKINYMRPTVDTGLLNNIRKTKQKIVQIATIMQYNSPIGYELTMHCDAKTETGRNELISKYPDSFYRGDNEWEIPK